MVELDMISGQKFKMQSGCQSEMPGMDIASMLLEECCRAK